jgi:predicted N-acetyltransferase YhbS
MLQHADILVTAWDDERLVGVARCVTDFHFACYLSDLAVDEAYQRQGIGRELQKQIKLLVKETCEIILLAAPAAVDYYHRLGYKQHASCWIMDKDTQLK